MNMQQKEILQLIDNKTLDMCRKELEIRSIINALKDLDGSNTQCTYTKEDLRSIAEFAVDERDQIKLITHHDEYDDEELLNMIHRGNDYQSHEHKYREKNCI